MKENNKALGFTLIELLVTIAIIAIIAMIAAPSFSNTLANQKLNSSARELFSTLTQARSQAVLLNKEITVTLNSTLTNTQTELYWSPASGNSLTAPATVPTLVFQANGTLKSNSSGDPFVNTKFEICSAKLKKNKAITLTRIGAVSMAEAGTCE